MGVFRTKQADFASAIRELLYQTGTLTVEFDDNERADIPVRKLVFHLFYFKIIRKWGLPVTSKYLVDVSTIGPGKMGELGTIILTDIRKAHPHQYQNVAFDFMELVNELNRFTIEFTQEYHQSLDIVDLVKVSRLPEVKKLTAVKVTDPNAPVADGEKHLRKTAEKLFKLLRKPHPQNALAPFTNLKFVSATQMGQIFHQIGYRTDINDSIIRYPVQGNYLDGLRNHIEYALEALSAKKSVFYNKESIPMADYFGRRQHLLLSAIEHLYPGDCGSKVYLPVLVTDDIKEMLLYKNVVEGPTLVCLDEDNVDQYVGKTIDMRTPLGCRHTDGICEACAGHLLSGVIPGVNIGIFSGVQTTERIVQVILSSKHMQATRSVEYVVPEEIREVFTKKAGGIFLKPKIRERWKNAKLVVPVSDASRLMNVPDLNINRVSSINETAFGRVVKVLLMKGDDPVTEMIRMEMNDQLPLYSRYLIKYIHDHPEMVTVRDELYIIDLKKFDDQHPIFRINVVNAAMVNFVKAAKALLENNARKYHSGVELYNEFASLVHSQVKVNSSYLEVVLRALMVSGQYDHRLPIVEDLNNVQFGANLELNMTRSIGVLAAFERLKDEVADPAWYVVPKMFTKFDEFLNLKPKIK